MNDKNPTKLSLGLALLIIGSAVLSAFFTYFPLTDADIFWHLAAGREMATHKYFLYNDPFSFTLVSAQWIDLHWLFQLLVYGLYKLGGYTALLFFKLTVVGLVAVLLCRTFPSKRYFLITAVLAPLLFFQVRYLIDVRPILITILCMALYVFLFEHARRTGKSRLLWLCLPLQIIWTNSQGLYMIGLFIIGAYWFEGVWELWKNNNAKHSNYPCSSKAPHLFTPSPCQGEGKTRLPAEAVAQAGSGRGEVLWAVAKPTTISLLFLSCILSCCLNPYGIDGLLLPFRLFSRINPSANNIFSMNISENVPLFSLTGHDAIYRTTVLCIAFAAGVLFLLNRKKTRIAHLILFCGFLLLAFIAMRNVLLFIIIAIPIIGYIAAYGDLEDLFKKLPMKFKSWIFGILIFAAFLALSVAVYCHVKIIATFPSHRMISPFRFPEKIVEHLKQTPVSGEMFNDIRYGGYLIWRFYPQKKVFIDTRLVIRSPQFFAEYLMLCDDPALFPQVARKFNVTQVILPSAIFPLYFKLIKWLYQFDEWHLQYTDGTSVLFVKNNVSAGPHIDLSDTNSLRIVIDDINRQWEHSEFVRREAFRHFIDLVKYLGLSGSADFIQNQSSRKEF